jgi:hypothetical protein
MAPIVKILNSESYLSSSLSPYYVYLSFPITCISLYLLRVSLFPYYVYFSFLITCTSLSLLRVSLVSSENQNELKEGFF